MSERESLSSQKSCFLSRESGCERKSSREREREREREIEREGGRLGERKRSL